MFHLITPGATFLTMRAHLTRSLNFQKSFFKIEKQDIFASINEFYTEYKSKNLCAFDFQISYMVHNFCKCVSHNASVKHVFYLYL